MSTSTWRNGNDPMGFSLKNIATLLTIASILICALFWVYSASADASEAKRRIEKLEENAVKKDDFKEVKEDLKEMRREIQTYIQEDRQRHERDERRTSRRGSDGGSGGQ